MDVRVEHLLPDEIEAAITATPVAYLPLGSIEYHSHHLPLGLDGLTAHGVCTRAAERTGGVVLPTLWWGTGGTHTEYPWTIMVPTAAPLRELIDVTLSRLPALGVHLAVLFSGHFADRQLAMIDSAAQAWNVTGTGLRALPLAVSRSDATLPPDHAGTFETTLLHALHPELVRRDRLPDPSAVPPDPPGPDGGFDHRHDSRHPLWGVMGPDPRRADLSRSDLLLEEIVDWTARQVAAAAP